MRTEPSFSGTDSQTAPRPSARRPKNGQRLATDVLNSEVSLQNRLHEANCPFAFPQVSRGDPTLPKLDSAFTSRPSNPLSRLLGCALPRPEAKRSHQDYCLMPEPVGVPVIVAALTISEPSFVLFHSVSSGLWWVTCKVRK